MEVSLCTLGSLKAKLHAYLAEVPSLQEHQEHLVHQVHEESAQVKVPSPGQMKKQFHLTLSGKYGITPIII